MECIEAIREYRDNKDKYLPLIDHEKSTFKAEFITAIVPDTTLISDGIAVSLETGLTSMNAGRRKALRW
jgi:hypothetical protein